MFLRSKDETFDIFKIFAKKIHVKLEGKVAGMRSNHGTKFENTKMDKLCVENGISHNFLATRILSKIELLKGRTKP